MKIPFWETPAFWISIVSLLFAVIAIIVSWKASNKANQIATGESESNLRNLISQARQHMEDRALHISGFLKGRKSKDLKLQEKKVFEGLLKAYKSAVEDWLNAYEETCARYLDNKIDKKRFCKTYKTEIKNIIEENTKEIYELMHPKEKSKYNSIWEVDEDLKNKKDKA